MKYKKIREWFYFVIFLESGLATYYVENKSQIVLCKLFLGGTQVIWLGKMHFEIDSIRSRNWKGCKNVMLKVQYWFIYRNLMLLEQWHDRLTLAFEWNESQIEREVWSGDWWTLQFWFPLKRMSWAHQATNNEKKKFLEKLLFLVIVFVSILHIVQSFPECVPNEENEN